MSKYEVHLTTDSVVVTVDADSKEKAVDIAIELADEKQLADWSAQDIYTLK